MRFLYTALVLLLAPMPLSAQEAVARLGADANGTPFVVRGTTDIEVFQPVMEAFLETRPEVQMLYEQWGSNDLHALALSECADPATDADMVISSAIDLQIKLVNDACARAYVSPATQRLPATSRWRDEIWGVTREPAVMIYNASLLSTEEIPASRFDLLDLLRTNTERFRGKIATYDIEASGLGYLFAFADSLEASTFGALMESLGRADAVATCCSAEIIEGVLDGSYLIAYNVLGSYALNRAAQEPRLAVVFPSDYTLILTRAALIPRDAAHPELAGAFLDFMLSDAGKQALRSTNLIVSFDSAEREGTSSGGPEAANLRAIPLSPALLVGSDKHKRMLMVDHWRSAFPQE